MKITYTTFRVTTELRTRSNGPVVAKIIEQQNPAKPFCLLIPRQPGNPEAGQLVRFCAYSDQARELATRYFRRYPCKR